LPGGIFTHWKAPPLHGARQKRSFRNAHYTRFIALDGSAEMRSAMSYQIRYR